MSKAVVALLFLVLAQSVAVDAADRIRMGFPDLAAQFLPLSLAEKRDFLKEQACRGNSFASDRRFLPRLSRQRSGAQRKASSDQARDQGEHQGERLYSAESRGHAASDDKMVEDR